MRRPRLSRIFIGLALATVAFTGCGVEPAANEPAEPTERVQSAVVGVDTFLYFRSNATGWGVDETTRLFSFPAPNVFARTYDVTQTWMISDADTAIVTETNQLDGWGTTQVFSGAASKRIVVPGSDTLVTQPPDGDVNFKVKYAVLGPQRALVNLAASPPTILIQSVADICAGVSCPNELRCEVLSNGLPTCVFVSAGSP